MTPTATEELTADDLAWARLYQRAPGKVPEVLAYYHREHARLLALAEATGQACWVTEATRCRRRVEALAVAMREKNRCRCCGKALKTDKSRAKGIGPECEADELAKAAG